MGLSASQARILLLTAKNDALELQAQLISNERLLLAQEQEEIANDYSDATSNQIYTCRVTTNNSTNGKEYTQKTMSLKTLAQSLVKFNADSTENKSTTSTVTEAQVTEQIGKTKDQLGETEFNKYDLNSDGKIDATDAEQAKNNSSSSTSSTSSTSSSTNGDAENTNSTSGIVYIKINGSYYGAKAEYDFANNSYNMKYYKDGQELAAGESDPVISALNSEGAYSIMQSAGRNGNLEVYVDDSSETNNQTNTSIPIGNDNFVRKSLESLSNVTSRYYTEDDAEAQAEYNSAMNRVSALDKRLENKLNNVETQKKAVETEIDSAKQIVKSNTERTFKYFS